VPLDAVLSVDPLRVLPLLFICEEVLVDGRILLILFELDQSDIGLESRADVVAPV
jgi:hypothetical protein